jgi:hypothetical protein
MTRAELEAMAQSMGVPLEEAAALLGETSVLRGRPPMRAFNPMQQSERSMRGAHPPPPVPSPPAQQVTSPAPAPPKAGT